MRRSRRKRSRSPRSRNCRWSPTKFWQLSQGSYSDYSEVFLYKDTTKEQFAEDCAAALKDLAVKLVEENVFSTTHVDMDGLANILAEKYGYSRVEAEEDFPVPDRSIGEAEMREAWAAVDLSKTVKAVEDHLNLPEIAEACERKDSYMAAKYDILKKFVKASKTIPKELSPLLLEWKYLAERQADGPGYIYTALSVRYLEVKNALTRYLQ